MDQFRDRNTSVWVLLRLLAMALSLVTLAAFMGPALIFGLPEGPHPALQTAYWLVTLSLLALQAVILIAVLVHSFIMRRESPASLSPGLLFGAALLAGGNAGRLALGIHLGGMWLELVEAFWYPAPLLLLGLAARPILRQHADRWWALPARLVSLAFPVMLLSASLARIDLRPYIGAATPTSVSWILAYAPTLLGVFLALAGWISLESGLPSLRPDYVLDLVAIVGSALLVVALASASGTFGFVLSAMITWGSGYQLFRAAPASAPLGLSLFLTTASVSAFIVVLWRLRKAKAPLEPASLAITAVMSGIFASPTSVLGSLTALALMWTLLTPGTALQPRALKR